MPKSELVAKPSRAMLPGALKLQARAGHSPSPRPSTAREVAIEAAAARPSCLYALELAPATNNCRNPGKSHPEQQWRQREERACLLHSPSPGWPTKPSAPTDTSRRSSTNSFTRWWCPRRGLPSAILSKAILKVAIPAGAQDADLRDEAHTKEGEEGQGYGREGGCTTGQPCCSRCR
jgi:hypothetical protein